MMMFTEYQTALIGFLRGTGKSPAEISQHVRINADAKQVTFYVDRLGLPATECVAVLLDRSTLAALELAATPRRMSSSKLAEMILTEILAAQSVGTVLNDGV